MSTAPVKHLDRVLLLSPVDLSDASGGRAMLSRTNLLLLRNLIGDRLVHLRPPQTALHPFDAWRGLIDGINPTLITDLVRRIDEAGVTQIFIDGSNYGAAAATLKKERPQVRIITFFHNVEARFFWGAARERRTPKSLAVLAANYLAERMAVRSSDVLVTLSDRDSAGLRRLYGRGADAVAPIVLEDRGLSSSTAPAHPNPYLLFVGGGFYANIAGMRWFAREVAPRISLPVKVVGRNMDSLAKDIAHLENIELIGAVDDLSSWYAGAALVIAPIFDGSGMKTKVAEALMHGKHMAGTPEAFSGYAEDVMATNLVCVDADAFVAASQAAKNNALPLWDPRMRALYERDHSPTVAKSRMATLLGLPDS